MKRCDEIQSIFPKLVEGEAGPAESLRVARHLGDCTVCKIVLAREHRLAEALGALDDPLPVNEAFLEKVMAALPSGPPPSSLSRARRRLIRLAGVGAVAAALGSTVHRLLAMLGDGSLGTLRTGLGFEGADRLLQSLGAGARTILAMLAGGVSSGSLRSPGYGDPGLSPGTFALATLLLLGAAAVFGLTAWSAAKPAAAPRTNSSAS